MRDTNTIELSEKIEVITGLNDDDKKTYFSMVQDIIDDDVILITLPMVEGELAFLHINEEITINYFRRHGQYCFRARVLERYRREDIYFFKIKRISEVSRIQRRNYFRLPKTIPVKLSLVSPDNQDSTENIHGYTRNIGGGGIGVVINRELPAGTTVKCMFELNGDSDLGLIRVDGKVVRCNHLQDVKDQFEIGICFDDISDLQRDEIIKFIFNEQRRLRKKGLI